MTASEVGPAFAALPGRYLILDREFMIVAASDAYLQEMGAAREQIVGRRVFDIVPDNRNAADASAVAATAASLSRVLAHKRPDRSSRSTETPSGLEGASAAGGIAHRYLLPVNTPVLDDAGEVRWIVHSAEEVAALLSGEQPKRSSAARVGVLDRLRAGSGVLAALPDPLFEVLRDHLVPVELHVDQIVLEQQEPATSVYFSFSGLHAIVRHLQDGSSIQVALAGNSCIFGLEALDQPGGSPLGVRTLVGGWALAIRASLLSGLMNSHPQLRVQLGQRSVGLITQISQTAACNARHSVDQRLALWLMTASDRLETAELRVTQERIATLLGTRRASISEALGRLSAAGLVTTARHAILLRDRGRLQRWACSCYQESLTWYATQPASRVRMTPEFLASLPILMKSWATGTRL